MPTTLSFSSVLFADGILILDMTPPVSVTGWAGEFVITKRKNGTPLITKMFASGYIAGQSGITVVDSTIGRFQIVLDQVDKSGMDFGNYFASFNRTNSGLQDVLAEGYITFK